MRVRKSIERYESDQGYMKQLGGASGAEGGGGSREGADSEGTDADAQFPQGPGSTQARMPAAGAFENLSQKIQVASMVGGRTEPHYLVCYGCGSPQANGIYVRLPGTSKVERPNGAALYYCSAGYTISLEEIDGRMGYILGRVRRLPIGTTGVQSEKGGRKGFLAVACVVRSPHAGIFIVHYHCAPQQNRPGNESSMGIALVC